MRSVVRQHRSPLLDRILAMLKVAVEAALPGPCYAVMQRKLLFLCVLTRNYRCLKRAANHIAFGQHFDHATL